MILLEYPFVFLAPFWLLPSIALLCLLIASSTECMHKLLVVENHAAPQTSGTVTYFLTYLWGRGSEAIRDIRADRGTEKLYAECLSKFSCKRRKNKPIRSRRHVRCTQLLSNFGTNANELSTLTQSSSCVNEMLGAASGSHLGIESLYRTVDDRTRKPVNSRRIRNTLKPFHKQFLTVKSKMKIRSGAKHCTDCRVGQITFASSGNCLPPKSKGRPILSIRKITKLFADSTKPTKSS
ncbi:hypothetical protein LIPSTDRAFT_68872 [Lipomyces starkeyi NRRL Y-11557]|uniref:Uncharacterized protein n=1 Tax=Lipomyces starkeyi NRRL Y-11557 TaxID=675824 RepID=A0A1E3QAP4_LIPST|nr:hypothetical protein LIPSTDRAFT_68872 [Lipomyces starkeyi NRRL Y-11557]